MTKYTDNTGHLWYLGATVVAVLLLSLCCHFRINFKLISSLAVILYIVGLLGDSYNGLTAPLTNIPVFNYLSKVYTLLFYTTRNGIFMGFIFVLMGASFSRCKVILKPLPALVGFLVSMVGLLVEVYMLKTHDIPIEYNMYIFLLPAAYFLFSFAYTIPLRDHAIYRRLRNIGMLVYFSHSLVNKLTALLADAIGRHCNVAIRNYQFVLALIMTLFLSVCIEWLSCKEKFKWINWILA